MVSRMKKKKKTYRYQDKLKKGQNKNRKIKINRILKAFSHKVYADADMLTSEEELNSEKKSFNLSLDFVN